MVWGRRTSKYMFELGMSNIAKIFNLKKFNDDPKQLFYLFIVIKLLIIACKLF